MIMENGKGREKGVFLKNDRKMHIISYCQEVRARSIPVFAGALGTCYSRGSRGARYHLARADIPPPRQRGGCPWRAFAARRNVRPWEVADQGSLFGLEWLSGESDIGHGMLPA